MNNLGDEDAEECLPMLLRASEEVIEDGGEEQGK
jgi:hypothetical protein